jgi:hypothetical protein
MTHIRIVAIQIGFEGGNAMEPIGQPAGVSPVGGRRPCRAQVLGAVGGC